jgi:hypothetical protein
MLRSVYSPSIDYGLRGSVQGMLEEIAFKETAFPNLLLTYFFDDSADSGLYQLGHLCLAMLSNPLRLL